MSDICGAATRRTAGALDPTEGPKAIDRAALKRAINLEFAHCIDDREATIETDAFYLLREAAKRHFETLPEPPKTKMVEVWHVEYAVWTPDNGWQPRIEICSNQVIAGGFLLQVREMTDATFVRVTGPHSHEVPA